MQIVQNPDFLKWFNCFIFLCNHQLFYFYKQNVMPALSFFFYVKEEASSDI